MIETSEQLYQAIEQMGRMQRILESYRNEILTQNPRNFAVLAEGPLEQLRQLQQQIDEYIRRLEASRTSAST
jgi:DNA anti-recombination protein RmuC